MNCDEVPFQEVVELKDTEAMRIVTRFLLPGLPPAPHAIFLVESLSFVSSFRIKVDGGLCMAWHILPQALTLFVKGSFLHQCL